MTFEFFLKEGKFGGSTKCDFILSIYSKHLCFAVSVLEASKCFIWDICKTNSWPHKNYKVSLQTCPCFKQIQHLRLLSGWFETADGKQTADHLKNSKFSFHTCLLWAESAFETSKWLIRKVNKQLMVNKQLTTSKLLNFHSKHFCLGKVQC